MRLVVDHRDPKALGAFAREIGSSGLSFAQGTAALIGGRPKPSPVVRLFTFLVDKARLADARFQIGDAAPVAVAIAPGAAEDVHLPVPAGQPVADSDETGETVEVPLLRVAHARSGDKGDTSNVAIIARRPEYFDWLCQELSAERIAGHFAVSIDGPVERFTAPGLSALNFVLHDALGGGGMASRRIDPQGKAYGQRALEMLVRVPRAWLRSA